MASRNSDDPRLRVADALGAVGSTLTGKEVKDLRQQGYSPQQLERIAGRVETVGDRGQKQLDRSTERDARIEAKEKSQAALEKIRSSESTPNIKTAVQAAGKTLTRSDLKTMQEAGYTTAQLGKIANRMDDVGDGANKLLNRLEAKETRADGRAPELPGPSSPGGSANYGTADSNGWLSAELKAIDTFKPDLTPTVFNNYRPVALGDRMRDAVDEANRFIDSTTASWGSDQSTLRPDEVSGYRDTRERELAADRNGMSAWSMLG